MKFINFRSNLETPHLVLVDTQWGDDVKRRREPREVPRQKSESCGQPAGPRRSPGGRGTAPCPGQHFSASALRMFQAEHLCGGTCPLPRRLLSSIADLRPEMPEAAPYPRVVTKSVCGLCRWSDGAKVPPVGTTDPERHGNQHFVFITCLAIWQEDGACLILEDLRSSQTSPTWPSNSSKREEAATPCISDFWSKGK